MSGLVKCTNDDTHCIKVFQKFLMGNFIFCAMGVTKSSHISYRYQ